MRINSPMTKASESTLQNQKVAELKPIINQKHEIPL